MKVVLEQENNQNLQVCDVVRVYSEKMGYQYYIIMPDNEGLYVLRNLETGDILTGTKAVNDPRKLAHELEYTVREYLHYSRNGYTLVLRTKGEEFGYYSNQNVNNEVEEPEEEEQKG